MLRARCNHAELQTSTSQYAEVARFQRPTIDRRLAATTRSGRNPLAVKGVDKKTLEADMVQSEQGTAVAFPGPLILPGDHLALDPKDPPQSFRSWLLEGERNKPSKKRETIYVARVSNRTTAQMRHVDSWRRPQLVNADQKGTRSATPKETAQPPNAEDMVRYLSAFYHGMPSKLFPERLELVRWVDKTPAGREKYVGLATGGRCTRIRVRPSPDGLYTGQLNLEDMLDAAIEMLPTDAYSLVILVEHDLYEDEDDDFCCGRAYGGSRVCVVSSARYHPLLDDLEGIDYDHMWPNSHCQLYVQDLCREEGVKPPVGAAFTSLATRSPIRSAIEAAGMLPSTSLQRPSMDYGFLELLVQCRMSLAIASAWATATTMRV